MDPNFNLPPGVTAKDISYPDPEPCPLCLGARELNATPCCGAPYVENLNGYHCFRCRKQYLWTTCPECDGEGVIDP